jgi:hypothetical protein
MSEGAMPDGWEWITEIAEARSQNPDAAPERVAELIRRNRDVRHASIFFATVRTRMVDAITAFNETAAEPIRFNVSGDPARVEQPLIFSREHPRKALMEVTQSATLMTVASGWRDEHSRRGARAGPPGRVRQVGVTPERARAPRPNSRVSPSRAIEVPDSPDKAPAAC